MACHAQKAGRRLGKPQVTFSILGRVGERVAKARVLESDKPAVGKLEDAAVGDDADHSRLRPKEIGDDRPPARLRSLEEHRLTWPAR